MRQLSAQTVARPALVIGALLSVALAGCSALRMALNRDFDPPSVAVVDGRVESLTFEGVDLAFDVEVGNPNAVGIDVTGFDYHIEIGGERVVVGSSDETQPVAGGSTSRWTVPASLRFASLLSSVASLAGEDEATFLFECAVRLDVPFLGEVSVPVTRLGALPLPKPPSISFDGMSLQGVSATAVSLLLKLRIDNPNGFLLRLDSLSYELGLRGDAWASASQDVGLELLGGATTIAELPVRVGLADIGAAALALVRAGGEIPLQLDGAMRLTAPLPQMPTAEAAFRALAGTRP
jgi:LEA14-like dessication related protein